MKTFKKQISVLLATMMVLCSFALTSFSASAAETTESTISVTSNLCDTQTVTYDENSEQVEVTYYLQSDNMIIDTQAVLNYDSSVLQLADGTSISTAAPVISSGAVANFALTDKVLFNATSLNLFDFTDKGVYFTVTFDIIGSGDTEVNLDVEILTATEATSYDELEGAEDIDLVYFDDIISEGYEFTSEATVTGGEVDKEVSIYGDINLDLAATDEEDIYAGSVELEAGTYTFNVNDDGTVLGFNYTFTDTAVIDYSAGYKAATTLVVSGGRYTFSYNASSKKLTIKFKAFDEIVELFGDINVELVRTSSTSTVFTGSARVEAGTYTFKIYDQGTEMGFGYTFDDVVYNVEYNAAWTSATTFNATGGIYSVKYDTSTNQLTFKHAPEGLGEVTVFGDISVPLANQGNNIYSATKVLEAGTYQFRIDSLGTTVCNGSTFTDTMNGVEYKSSWKAATTFIATEKLKFTFIFDTSTNKIKIFDAPIDTTKVLVAFENSNLELTSTDSVTYTATTTLEAGTYTFRMDEFGVTMGYNGTYTDTISGIQYNASYSAATTFIATGGDYTFSFNVNTNKLTVKKV